MQNGKRPTRRVQHIKEQILETLLQPVLTHALRGNKWFSALLVKHSSASAITRLDAVLTIYNSHGTR